jgi:hypothetical protein
VRLRGKSAVNRSRRLRLRPVRVHPRFASISIDKGGLRNELFGLENRSLVFFEYARATRRHIPHD